VAWGLENHRTINLQKRKKVYVISALRVKICKGMLVWEGLFSTGGKKTKWYLR